jgi:hypothetical protein
MPITIVVSSKVKIYEPNNQRYGIIRFKRPPEIEITDENEVAAMGLWWSSKDPMKPSPREQKGGTINWSNEWLDWHDLINDVKGAAYVRSVRNFICNRDYVGGPSWPDPEKTFDPQMHAEPVSGSGNIHRVIGECPTHWMLDSISNRTDPKTLDPKIYNWKTDVRFFKCAAQNKYKDGLITNVQSGVDCMAALLREGENPLWIWKSSLEMLQQPPFKIQNKWVVDLKIEGCSVKGVLEDGSTIYLLKSTKPGERIFTPPFHFNSYSVIPPRM